MRPTVTIPEWASKQVLTSSVSPSLRTILDNLPVMISLHVEVSPHRALPPGLAALLKAALVAPILRLESLSEVSPPSSCRLTAVSCFSELTMEEGELERSLETAMDRLVMELLPPGAAGALLRKVALVGSTATTLSTITTHMLSTYDLDKALYVMLSGITAGYGLGFNRAIFFHHHAEAGCLRGHAAIGPADDEEAHRVWEDMEAEAPGIEELITNYDSRCFDTRLLSLAREIEMPLSGEEDELTQALATSYPVRFQPQNLVNPHLAKLNICGEFVLAAVRAHHRLMGLIFADDCYLPRDIDPLRLHHLKFFIDQTALICENLELLNHQQELARRDPLTGALNRRELDLRLWQAVEQAVDQGTTLALLILDVDLFKEINDKRGHAEGDRILRGVVKLAQSLVRAEDVVARYGGDEFVLILPGATAAAAESVARRILERVRQRLRVTVSIGYAVLPHDGASDMDLFALADDRLFQAKRSGRGQVVGN